ncbi:MAG: hypothetical protein ABSA46_04660 [Thermodesulfovibrionales bacterium]
MIILNEDIKEIIIEVPAGHKHLRAFLVLEDGTEMVFQEATIANLVRAFITLKTHPLKDKVKLKRVKLTDKKKGYAEWQLLETED